MNILVNGRPIPLTYNGGALPLAIPSRDLHLILLFARIGCEAAMIEATGSRISPPTLGALVESYPLRHHLVNTITCTTLVEESLDALHA